MSDPVTVRGRLEGLANQLGQLSSDLNGVQEAFAVAEGEYQKFMDDFEVGLYLKSEENGMKLPSAAMRERLARREISPELLGRRDGLFHKRTRLTQRIRDLKAEIDAERSILSALKEEMSATR